jgi:hypothetical protein
MLQKLLTTALILAATYVVVTSIPDIVRYMKIREM